jgi:hypothetical protein
VKTRLFRSLVLAAALSVVGCTSGDGPTGLGFEDQSPDPALSSSGLLGTPIGSGLLACNPLPYASTQKTIGAAGGIIDVGPHRLTIPAGALSQPVLIKAEAPVGQVNSVKFLPEGLTFAKGKPAKLTMSYANCPLVGRILPKRIAYTNDLLQILSYILSVDDLLAKKVTGTLEHFSRYAVAW